MASAVFSNVSIGDHDVRIDALLGSGQNRPQTAVIGPEITVRGNVGVLQTFSGVGLDFSGTVIGGADDDIVLRDIQTTAGFHIDSPTGTVTIDDPKPNLKVTGTGDSRVIVTDIQRWNAAELSIDVQVRAGGSLELLGSEINGGTTINGTINLLGDDTDRANFYCPAQNQCWARGRSYSLARPLSHSATFSKQTCEANRWIRESMFGAHTESSLVQ